MRRGAGAIVGATPDARPPNLMILPRLSLRSKLAFIALPLLALPWAGYLHVQEMERFLMDGQRQAMVATARAVATALHERPRLFGGVPAPSSAVSVADSILPNEQVLDLAISSMPELPPQAPPFDGVKPATRAVDGAGEVEAILRGLERSTARIWVVDRNLEVIARVGSLLPAATPAAESGWLVRLWRRFGGGLGATREDIAAQLADVTPPSAQGVQNAFFGATASWVRPVGNSGVSVVAAAQPVWAADRVQGAVVVEESTQAIASVRDRAFARLILLTFTGFAIAAVVVLGFATRLSWRIRRLRDEAENAIDARGRITDLAAASNAGDEVGDLSRSFSRLLGRLAQHHGYLETMASRLSHELRTPVAVVRSSLENLQLDTLPAGAQTYLDRADAGLLRLTRILARMSEATRMEQALATTDVERFDLRAVVAECVGGYRVAHPRQGFEEALPPYPVWVRGAPDLAAQMLDKLVDNAVDFARGERPVVITLAFVEDGAELAVSNHGPLLPAALEGRLFDSMVSGRAGEGGDEPHLGLGLYVAQLIAGFHGGTLHAENLLNRLGVRVFARLPVAA